MKKPRRDACAAGGNHIWVIKRARGHDEVHCACCYQCLGVEAMLRSYVDQHGGEIRHES